MSNVIPLGPRQAQRLSVPNDETYCDFERSIIQYVARRVHAPHQVKRMLRAKAVWLAVSRIGVSIADPEAFPKASRFVDLVEQAVSGLSEQDVARLCHPSATRRSQQDVFDAAASA